MGIRPERRNLRRGERRDRRARVKRDGRDGDGERQEGKSELEGGHVCEIQTTGGIRGHLSVLHDVLYL